MISRRGSIIRALVVFGSLAVAALAWRYSVVYEQRIGGTVEVQQLKEPAWGVEIKDLSSEAGSVAGTANSNIVIAERVQKRRNQVSE